MLGYRGVTEALCWFTEALCWVTEALQRCVELQMRYRGVVLGYRGIREVLCWVTEALQRRCVGLQRGGVVSGQRCYRGVALGYRSVTESSCWVTEAFARVGLSPDSRPDADMLDTEAEVVEISISTNEVRPPATPGDQRAHRHRAGGR